MKERLQIDKDNIWHPFGPLRGHDRLLIERGEGAHLITPEGRRIFDGVSSWWVNLHGHGHPDIAQAIAHQALTLEQVIFAGFTHEPAIRLSEDLLSVLPDNQSKIFFSDDGSTSVEVALKLALQYWRNVGERRSQVIALEGAYHGDTFGAMSVAERNMFSAPFDDKLFDVQFIPFPVGDGANTVEAFAKACNDHTAAFIFEPLVQGAGGMRIYAPEVLDQLLAIAAKHSVITIADEVMTGFYRTGRFFASHYLTHQPDLFCMSKGLTGGFLPMGITSTSQRMVEAFDSGDYGQAFWHGHSYTANPLACAAANASFDLLVSEDCQQRIIAISNAHRAFVNRMKDHPKLERVASLGTVLSMAVTVEDSGYSSSIRDRMYFHFLSKDLLLRPLGNVLYLLPPYVTSIDQLEVVYAEIESFLQEL